MRQCRAEAREPPGSLPANLHAHCLFLDLARCTNSGGSTQEQQRLEIWDSVRACEFVKAIPQTHRLRKSFEHPVLRSQTQTRTLRLKTLRMRHPEARLKPVKTSKHFPEKGHVFVPSHLSLLSPFFDTWAQPSTSGPGATRASSDTWGLRSGRRSAWRSFRPRCRRGKLAN